MNYETITHEKEDYVSIIRLNRPDKRNAINKKMGEELINALEDAGNDNEIRAVIITGGTEVFSAGADINDSPSPRDLGYRVSPKKFHLYYHVIEDMGKPVIAAIAGYCLGGGLELAATCDIRIAAENAIIGDAHSKIGVIGGGGSCQRLTRLIGIAKTKELVFTGDSIDAFEAYRIGLVNKVVPVDDLFSESKKLASLMKERPPLVIKLAKMAIDDGIQMSLAQALDYQAKCAAVAQLSEDAQEGRRAFLEKRKPRFKGR